MMKAPNQVAAGFSLRSGVGDMYWDESFYSRSPKKYEILREAKIYCLGRVARFRITSKLNRGCALGLSRVIFP
jgi:hypothetical protein